jgi:hypothetical protein
MKTNVGSVDRMIRLVIGLVLVSMIFFGPRTPIGYLGFVVLGTALLRFCPLYALLGISTARAESRRSTVNAGAIHFPRRRS